MNVYKKATIKDYNIIIIPDRYGSFVLENTMFITREACLDKQQLIHELIHTNWNPKCKASIQQSRFFDEAITQYFTYRICDYYSIKNAQQLENEFIDSYIDIMTTYDVVPIPISKYSEEGMGLYLILLAY